VEIFLLIFFRIKAIEHLKKGLKFLTLFNLAFLILRIYYGQRKKKGESEGRVGFLAFSSCLSVRASSFVLFSAGCLFVWIFGFLRENSVGFGVAHRIVVADKKEM
jgi:hypothetical protein